MRFFYAILIRMYAFERDIAVNPAVRAQASAAVTRFEALRDRLILRGA